MEAEEKKPSWAKNSLADIVGGIGRGFALVAVGHPLDTVKVTSNGSNH